jgi:hypothetical protein
MPVIDQSQRTVQPFFPMADLSAPTAPAKSSIETVTVTAPAASKDADDKSFFDNLLDVVNPLEHLPIVSTIYSNLTGDKPNDFTQVAGDTLYGGALGLVSSVGNLIFKDATGKSVGDTVWGWVTGQDSGSKPAASSPSHPAEAPRRNVKPSSDLFSFLNANVESGANETAVASNTTAAPAASSVPVSVAAASARAATMQPASLTPSQTSTAAAAPASESSAIPARVLNPLPARGEPTTMHRPPSENARAAGMAAMVAQRAHLKTPDSEMKPAAQQTTTAAPVQNSSDTKQIASAEQKPATVPVGPDGIPTLNGNGEQALLDALNKNGISGAIGQQALMAYQKTMAMSPDASNAAALTSAMTLH